MTEKHATLEPTFADAILAITWRVSCPANPPPLVFVIGRDRQGV